MKALIFDMDGVLVDVSQSYRVAIKKTAEFFIGEDVSAEDIQAMKDKGGFNNDWKLTEALILEKGKKAEFNEIVRKFQEIYQGSSFDGLIKNERWLLNKNVLSELKERFVLGIVTGRPREEAEFALKNSDTNEFFDVLVTMDDVEDEKPSPIPLKVALESMGCSEGYYVGDTIDDMQMAVSGGLVGVGVIPPGVSASLKQSLADNGAKYVLDDISQIREVLGNQ